MSRDPLLPSADQVPPPTPTNSLPLQEIQPEATEHLDICRVCRCEGTKEQPLFYPCLCSGSIKYIHQECLVEWLRHSKKKYCELCKHEFTFTSLYKNETPKSLPISLYLLGMSKQVARFVSSVARHALVIFTWLVAVPLLTTCAFQYLFGMSLFSVTVSNKPFSELERFAQGIVVIMSILQGLFMNISELITILIGILLKEYLETISYWNRFQPVPTPSPSESTDNTNNPHTVLNSDDNNEEVVISGYEGVTAREYRAYLRRQKLYRERIEREQSRLRERLNRLESNFVHHEEDATDHAQTEPNVDDQQSTLSLTSNRTERPIHMTGGVIGGITGTSSLPMREPNIRCRICNSRTCVSLDHLRQASQRQRASAIGTNQHQQTPTTPQTENNIQTEVIIDIDLTQILCLKGPMLYLLRNAMTLWIFNLIFMYGIIQIPSTIGSTFVEGKIQKLGKLVFNLLVDFIQQVLLVFNVSIPLSRISNFNSRLPNINFSAYMTVLTNLYNELDSTESYPQEAKTFISHLLVGYFVIITTGYVYLLFAGKVLPRSSFYKSCFKFVMFLGVAVKVTIMTVVELGLFPLFTGFIADVCLLPLTKDTVWSRASFTVSHPVSSVLIHWAFGLTFMLFVALLVTKCRRILRPGLLYFLRDPSDVDFSPAREMIEASLLLQAKRIFKSAIIYTIVAISLLFGFAKSASILAPNLNPINLSVTDPITEIPMDILLQTILRSIFQAIQPEALTDILKTFFHLTSRILCLSSYIRGGGRYCTEETLDGRWVLVPGTNKQFSRERITEMQTRPVEPIDIAKLPIIEGRAQQHDIASMAASMLHSTESDTRRSRRALYHRRTDQASPPSSSSDFCVVFIPPAFKLRLFAFLVLTWAFLVLTLHVGLLAPVCIGRWIFSQWFTRPIHEMYTWVTGFSIVVLAIKTIHTFAGLIARLSIRVVFYEWPVAVTKALLFSTVVFGVWPLLLGIYLNCLIWPLVVMDFQLPILFFLSTWMCGLPLIRLAYHTRTRLLNPTRQSVIDNHFIRPTSLFTYPLIPVLKHLILPLTLKGVFTVFAPLSSVTIFGPLFGLQLDQIQVIQRWSTLVSLILPVMVVVLSFIRYAHGHMRQRVFDEAYSLGRQLRNLDQAE